MWSSTISQVFFLPKKLTRLFLLPPRPPPRPLVALISSLPLFSLCAEGEEEEEARRGKDWHHDVLNCSGIIKKVQFAPPPILLTSCYRARCDGCENFFGNSRGASVSPFVCQLRRKKIMCVYVFFLKKRWWRHLATHKDDGEMQHISPLDGHEVRRKKQWPL